MNGDIPNFAMGPKEEDNLVGGNLQEEVFVILFLNSFDDLTLTIAAAVECSR
jgi:hypothetical protein